MNWIASKNGSASKQANKKINQIFVNFMKKSHQEMNGKMEKKSTTKSKFVAFNSFLDKICITETKISWNKSFC